jgi:hypothetical protein
MKKFAIFVVVVFCFNFTAGAVACDKEGARKLQDMLKGMATWYEKDGRIIFKWGDDWDHATSEERLGLIRAFANTDACLMGKAREIKFYRKGKLVGEASPTRGIELK